MKNDMKKEIKSDIFYITAWNKKFKILIWGNPEDKELIPAVEIDKQTGNETFGDRKSMNIELDPWFSVIVPVVYEECKHNMKQVAGKPKKFIVGQLNKDTRELEIIFESNIWNDEIFKAILNKSPQIRDYLARKSLRDLYKKWNKVR